MEIKECPICSAQVRYWERHPNQVCEDARAEPPMPTVAA